MRVVCIKNETDFLSLSKEWNRLAGDAPFKRWEWMEAWCRTLGAMTSLRVLVVYDEMSRPIGIAPFCLESSLNRGRVLRFIGSGKACSDYMGLLTEQRHLYKVAAAVGTWLSQAASGEHGKDEQWELLELEGVAEDDASVRILTEHLDHTQPEWSPSLHCWKVELPDDWEEYLGSLTKRARRKLRQLQKEYIQTGRATWNAATTDQEFRDYLKSLIELHTARRVVLGEGGCFDHPGFESFLVAAAEGLFAADKLWLTELRIDGRVAANAVGVVHGAEVSLYQCGFDPQLSSCNPGWIQNIFNLRRAIELRKRSFDFLRGDEPYKKRLNGKPVAMFRVRVAAPDALSRLRHRIWNVAGSAAKILPGITQSPA